MTQEKYNLNWHTYSDHLSKMLHDMMKSEELTDVTLVCDDKRQFRAHKIVLSACSSVFKQIIKDLPINSSVIYLRGIQHQEMESIIEFMYLGVATFYQERMDEFLNVAKSLEIKEISKDVVLEDENVKNEEPEIAYNEGAKLNINENTDRNGVSASSTQLIDYSHLQKTSDGMFDCDQCAKRFKQKKGLIIHIQSIHEGKKFDCNHCEYQATQLTNLKTHIKSKHEEVKYYCSQCEYQTSWKHHLTRHIQSRHEGLM